MKKNTGKNTQAKKPKKQSNAKSKNVKRMRAVNPFLRSIMDPCEGHLNARIPDGTLWPTATAQVQFRTTIASDANGNLGIQFTPADVAQKPTATGTNKFWMPVALDVNGNVTSVTATAPTVWSSFAEVNTLWPLLETARVVSACIDLEYVGTTAQDSGFMVAGEFSGDQAFSTSPATNNGSFVSFDQACTASGARMLPVRTGAKIKFYPSCPQDLRFNDAATNASGNVTYGQANALGGNSSLFFLARGCAVSTNIFSALVTINVEYNPAGGAPADSMATAGSHPEWLTSVQRYVSMVENVVQAARDVVPLVGSMFMMGASAYRTIRRPNV